MQITAANTLKIDCTHCPIRHKAICAKCEPDELAVLNSIKYYKSVPAGKLIAVRGEALDHVASVVAGVATLNRTMDDGRTQMVGMLLPSDFMGRPGREAIGYDVTAVTDLTLCCFRRKPFEDLLIKMPHVQERLLEMALDELDAARDWMLLLGRKTAREKIASLLVFIIRRAVHPEGRILGDASRVELPLTREAMANYLGLTVETVSRQLTQLKKDGIIGLEGPRGILIPDYDALCLEAGADE